jgi:sodium-dependent dicarboxylate transporter 2/3/5
MNKVIGLVLGPLVFILLIILPISDLSHEAQSVLALTFWMAIWWVSEAIPLPATALLPLVVLPLTEAVDIKQTAQVYSSPIIYLFLGGFAMALSIERWQLHKRLALNIILKVGDRNSSIVLGFMLATALLSMWISNTATSLMLLPIALAILSELEEHSGESADGPFAQALLLSIAYSASIGGTATLIGTPTNLIFSASSESLLQTPVSFTDWMLRAAPLSILSLLLCWLYLTRAKFRFANTHHPELKPLIQQKLDLLGPLRYEEKWILIVFGLAVFGWIFRTLFLQSWLPGLSDAGIAIMGALVLFILPAREKGRRLLEWPDMKALPWGILLLFGGGLSLAAAFSTSGLAAWLAERFLFLEGIPSFVILLFLVTAVNFITEITSNVATASVLMPVLASLGNSLGIDSFTLMFACAVTASYAFMLPVATAPNAVVFSSNRIPIHAMARTGFALNVMSILLISLYHYIFFPL